VTLSKDRTIGELLLNLPKKKEIKVVIIPRYLEAIFKVEEE
jgi:hypothetical protein